MRKYIIGFMVGAALTFAIQAGAATLLDSTVDAIITVEVDGESLGQAPVIDGVSYLPVRKFGNKAGYKVDFGEGKAILTNEVPEVETPPIVPANNFTLETIQTAIENQESAIHLAEVMVKVATNNGSDEQELKKLTDGLEKMKVELDRLKAIKAEIEAQP